jgi:small subunit ribosomal protein S16
VAVKIKLMRFGKIRAPYYRIVVADARKARNGLSIEEIGKYAPTQEPSLIEVNSERVQHWLKTGAQPTEPVIAILKVTGDWQKFKGLPGAEGTLRVAPPKPNKRAAFEAAVKDAENAPKDGATTAKKKLEAKAVKVEAPVAVVAEVPEVPEVTEVAEVAASEAPVVNEAVIEAVETSAVTDVVAVAEVLAAVAEVSGGEAAEAASAEGEEAAAPHGHAAPAAPAVPVVEEGAAE